MPSNDPAYQREYMRRRRESMGLVGRQPNNGLNAPSAPPKPAARPRRPARYTCGCEPGLPCMSHAIQALPARAVNEILARLPRAAARERSA